MRAEEWVPAGIDTERPSAARVYDYVLGGAHNFAVDRKFAEQLLAVDPATPLMAQANRAFLRRAVEFLVDAGVRQFLDIGSGIPTVGHVHEIAQTKAPESRVVFVDLDPVAVAHTELMLADNKRTAVIREDARHAERILEHRALQDLFDLDQPVAVLVVALLHYIPDADDPSGIIARLMQSFPAGSYVALSHGTADGPVDMAKMQQIGRRGGVEVAWRTRDQVERLFDGFELVEPGVVWVPLWRPESTIDVQYEQPEASGNYAGVACKR